MEEYVNKNEQNTDVKADKTHDFFLSYRRVDNEDGFVTKLFNKLESRLMTGAHFIFFDTSDLPTGAEKDKERFWTNLKNAIKNCNYFIPIITKAYVDFDNDRLEDFCEKELTCARQCLEKKGKAFAIVPIVLNKSLDGYQIKTDDSNEYQQGLSECQNHISFLKGTNYLSFNSNDIDNEEKIDELLIGIFNSIAKSGSDITPFKDFLDMQEDNIQKIEIYDGEKEELGNCLDFGITKKKNKQEKENEKSIGSNFLNSANGDDILQTNLEGFISNIKEDKRAVVVGDAGQGKSVFLKRICKSLSEEAKNNWFSKKVFFPIYIEVATLYKALQNNKIIDAIAVAAGNGMCVQLLNCILRNGTPCFLFDAIDEIPPDEVDKIIKEINKEHVFQRKNVHMIFSSRPNQREIANDSFSMLVENKEMDVRRWDLNPISDERLSDFAQEIINQITDSKVTSNEFVKAVKDKEKEDDRYRSISRNPLLLKMTALEMATSGTLPASKVKIFDSAVNRLIDRDEGMFSDSLELKQVLGKLAFEFYSAKDNKTKFEADRQTIVETICNMFPNDSQKKTRDSISNFLKVHTLVDRNGFSHDLFACYYCAFYIYRLLCNNKTTGEKRFEYIKEHANAECWRGVVEMIILLLEANAAQIEDEGKKEELKALLDRMLTSMQEEQYVTTPDYDLLCGAVVQFIDEDNRTDAETNLIFGMLARGERGINTFDDETYECTDGANPYEELFYYVVRYDMMSDVKFVFSHMQEKGTSQIQMHLLKELCEIMHIELNIFDDDSDDDYVKVCNSAASAYRTISRVTSEMGLFKGHVVVDLDDEVVSKLPMMGGYITSIKVVGNGDFNIIINASQLEYIVTDSERYISKNDCLIDKKYIDNEGKNWVSCVRCTNHFKEFPDEVERIKAYAFLGCNKIERITISKNIRKIENGAIQGCNSLEEIDVDKGNRFYQSEGNCVFCIDNGKKYLVVGCKASVMPTDGSVCSIVESAFAGSKISGCVKIPEGIRRIGLGSFSNCDELTKIYIPDSVTVIYPLAFSSCNKLECIEVSLNNNMFYTEDNCLIDRRNKSIIWGNKNSKIPTGESVNIIGEGAFWGCIGLEEITIPQNINKINELAFCNCQNLKKININGSVTGIGYGAFGMCRNLETIELAHGIEYIEGEAFGGCVKLNSINFPKSLLGIGRLAFAGSGIKEVTIPNSVTVIEEGAFQDCRQLNKVKIGKGLKEISDNLFSRCSALHSIEWENVERIGKVAFYDCTELTSITIPDSVTDIGDFAFDGCNSLRTISFGTQSKLENVGISIFHNTAWYDNQPDGMVYLGVICYGFKGEMPQKSKIRIREGTIIVAGDAFSECGNLLGIDIPSGVVSIGAYAFEECNELKRIKLPYSLKSVGDYAFLACSQLKKIEFSNEVESIGEYAFMECVSLKTVRIPNSVRKIGDAAFDYCTGLTTIKWNATSCESSGSSTNPIFSHCPNLKTMIVGENVKSLPPFILYENTSLTKVKIGKNLERIGDYAFKGCSGLKSLQFPNKLVEIGRLAFWDCTRIKEIEIGENIEIIGEGAFYGCIGLVAVNWDAICCKKSGSNKYPVFSQCTNIKMLSIGEHVTHIPSCIFSSSVGITNLTIPNNVTSIDSGAFFGLSSLESIAIPFVGAKAGVTNSDTYQYPFGYIFGSTKYTGGVATEQHYHGSSISNTTDTTYYIPSSLKSVTVTGGNIFEGAFSNCRGLMSITIPDSVTDIGDGAFWHCDRLCNFVIPAKVTTINGARFGFCRDLESITVQGKDKKYHIAGRCLVDVNIKTLVVGVKNSDIPSDNSVKSIGPLAFSGRSGVHSITIPNSVADIEYWAFCCCSELTSIIIGSGVMRIEKYAFAKCDSLETVYYYGDEEQWDMILISPGNECLKNAKRYYYSEIEPDFNQNKNYWHYAEDGKTPIAWEIG